MCFRKKKNYFWHLPWPLNLNCMTYIVRGCMFARLGLKWSYCSWVWSWEYVLYCACIHCWCWHDVEEVVFRLIVRHEKKGLQAVTFQPRLLCQTRLYILSCQRSSFIPSTITPVPWVQIIWFIRALVNTRVSTLKRKTHFISSV